MTLNFSRSLIFAASVLASHATAHADASIADTLRAFREGQPARAEAGVVDVAPLAALSEEFAKTLLAEARPDTPKCARFNTLSVRAARDLALTLRAFKGPSLDVNDPSAVYAHARLQVALPMFAQLKSFIDEDREGGYGFLDRRQKNACAYRDRAAVKTSFTRLADATLAFQRAALGTPGLNGLESLTERLLTLALRDEVRSQRIDSFVNVGVLAATWFGYPVVSRLLGRAWLGTGLTINPVVGAVLKMKPVRFAGRVAFTVADGLAWGAVQSWMNPAEAQRTTDTQRPQFDFGSWAERIADAEKFFASKLEEPQLYLAYVSTLQGDLASVLARQVGDRPDDVKAAMANDPEISRELQDTIWLANEAMFLRGQIPTVAARQLPEFIFAKFGVRVACGLGQPLGPSPLQCLIGERRVARALYSGALPVPSADVLALSTVNVSTKKEFRVVPLESSVRIDLPYKQPPARMAQMITQAGTSHELLGKLKLQKQFEITFAAWSKAQAIPIEFDPDVGLSAQWNAIANLSLILQREPDLLQRSGSALYLTKPIVSTGYRTLFERHLKLQEAMPAAASYDDMVKFLRSARAEKFVAPALSRVTQLNESIQTVSASIKSKWSVEARCSEIGAIRLARCLATLKRIDRFATEYPNVHVDADVLMVTGIGEGGDQFEKAQNPDNAAQSFWLVRDTFQVVDMLDVLKASGWLED